MKGSQTTSPGEAKRTFDAKSQFPKDGDGVSRIGRVGNDGVYALGVNGFAEFGDAAMA